MQLEELEGLKLRQGDVISVHWVDIYEDSVGDPGKAELAPRFSVGLYWGARKSHGIESLVTTTTLDVEDSNQQGYCIYPLSCVLKLGILKRTRRKGGKDTVQTGSKPKRARAADADSPGGG